MSKDEPFSYAYSLNAEDFQGDYSSREAAIEGALEEVDDEETIDTGVVVRQAASSYTVTGLAARIIETMQDVACELVGEAHEGWLEYVSDEQVKELDSAFKRAIDQWADRHDLHPEFGRVEEVQQHPVPKDPTDDD